MTIIMTMMALTTTVMTAEMIMLMRAIRQERTARC